MYYRQIYFWWWDQKCLKRTKLDLCCFFSLPTIDNWVSNACKSMMLCMHPLCDSECCAVKDWVIVNKFCVNVNNQFLSKNQINICVQTLHMPYITQNARPLYLGCGTTKFLRHSCEYFTWWGWSVLKNSVNVQLHILQWHVGVLWMVTFIFGDNLEETHILCIWIQ